MPVQQRRGRVRRGGNPLAGGLDQYSQVREERRLINNARHLCPSGVAEVAVEVVLEVGKQLLLAATGLQVAKREFRRVVERLPRGGAEGRALLGDSVLVQHLLRVENRL